MASRHSRLFRSIGHAIDGIKALRKEEINFTIELFFAFLAIIVSFLLKISHVEWSVIILLISIVLVAETFNTAIENIMDFISLEKNPKIKIIKDLSAAAVFIISITSVIIGFLIFIPKIYIIML